MKRTYKLLGYLLLGIGTYTVFNTNNTNLQATTPQQLALHLGILDFSEGWEDY